MKKKKVYAVSETSAFDPLAFNPNICDGCNRCVEVCQVDLLMPNPENGKPPLVLYPSECWYGGSCVEVCPKPGAIRLNILLMNRVHWKTKSSVHGSGNK